ncbi:tau-tubulin kinase 1 [Platysternon megacephalum]|uniref:Tau-tubulin kinase 1 n=1 Tax=Platysternon megacephalum TaxID=55544 RepID=A0A4D9DRA2_9SAUR|nr:tau-tubulin kinase 1 [Platysternon megacephalum]
MDWGPSPPNQTELQAPQQSIPECPICYGPYDNIFQRPLLLPCAHTFCLECLSRICVFVKQAQTFPCPLCRAQVSVPSGGIPKLPPNMDVVTQFPPWLQTLQEVWLDGHRLCWIKQPSLSCQVSAGEEAPEMLVTVELLYNPAPRDVSRRDLIGIHHPSRLSTCRGLCQLLWERRLAVFWIAILLLVLIVLPIIFIPDSHMTRTPEGQRQVGTFPTADAPSSSLSRSQSF